MMIFLQKMFAQKSLLCSLCRRSGGKMRHPTTRLYATESATADVSNQLDSGRKINKVMRAYVERSRAYNEFMKKEEREFEIGKRHLANMMGVPFETFTQKDVDEAIEYLFPSGIYDRKARPFMKPPAEVFPPKKEAQFDETGRPFHFLFFTGKSNFYSILHETVAALHRMNGREDAMIRSKTALTPVQFELAGSRWCSKDELEQTLVEELEDREYDLFVSALERLSSHPLAYTEKELIMKQRKVLMEVSKKFEIPEPITGEDGRLYSKAMACPRKSARADVTVVKPGTGLVVINGRGIDHFETIQSRNQILFPLELTGLRDRVDVLATVTGGGETGQAGAIRFGIAWALRSFVSADMVETMRLAGLLTKDPRCRERKKPGQEGARRKFTWKKR